MMEIRRLRNARFGTPSRYAEVTGRALYDPIRGGYYAFSNDRGDNGVVIPYIPLGEKKALKAIIDEGGFVTMEGMEIIQSFG